MSVAKDGTDEKTFHEPIDLGKCTPDGQNLLGPTPLASIFPDDKITSRKDKGLLKLNLDTGKCEVLVSIEEALSKHPQRDEIKSCHLFINKIIPHPQLERVLFVFSNALWRDEYGEPRIHAIYSANLDGSSVRYLGNFAHHPQWHPLDDLIIVYARDFNRVMRFGLYKGDGSGPLNYIPDLPNYPGSGHASYSPDGRYITTDRYWTEEGKVKTGLFICDPGTGREWKAAQFNNREYEYATIKAIRNRPKGPNIFSLRTRTNSRQMKKSNSGNYFS